MKNAIITQQNLERDDIALVGGKGMNLFRLVEAGVRVPPLVVVSTQAYRSFIRGLGKEFRNALTDLDTSTPQSIAKTAKLLRSIFTPDRLSATLRRDILSTVEKEIEGKGFLAVRSSATTEDSAEFSYAGQLDSFLFCRTEDEIIEALVNCWASGFSDRAVAYRAMKNLPQDGMEVAVVIQRMIDGVASGVTFTVNPLTRRQDEMLINATWGLGEGLVSGVLNADQFTCRKLADLTIEPLLREIVEKAEMITFDKAAGQGTIKVDVPLQEQKAPSLDDTRLREVATTCAKLETHCHGVPQDVEWTIDRFGGLFILQTRPITTLDGMLAPSTLNYETIWDNSNIVESYSGITSPLTFTFALDAYHMVYVQFCEVLKVPKAKINESDFFFANMLGLLHGRVYYNLKNWYRLISVLPGYEYNSRFMEQMMGVKKKLDFKAKEEHHSAFRRYFVELPRLLWSGANLFWQFLTIDGKVRRFMRIYQAMYSRYQHHDFTKDEAHRIIDIYFELETHVLRNWKAPIINDFMAMIFYGMVKVLIEKWGLDEDGTGSLQNELIAGQGDVESTLPMKRLQLMARWADEHPAVAERLKTASEDELVALFCTTGREGLEGDEKEFARQVHTYLDEFGDRSMNELKLEEPSLLEKPQFIFRIMKNYLGMPIVDAVDGHDRERELRENAERHAKKILHSQGPIGMLKHALIFKPVVHLAKKAVAFREYQRFARTKMFGLVRRMFLGIGHRFHELGVIETPNDIFWLTKQEIFSFTVGTSTIRRLSELVRLRKEEFAGYEAEEELPDRIRSYGPVYANDLTEPADPVESGEIEPGVFKGTSCCPGIVRKAVKVIMHPKDDMALSGEILVAARTDPGWVPLYPSASGLLIERGSMLSHSAIVAREMGLPAIVGINGITKVLKTGDIVEMDGARGLVRIIEQQQITETESQE